MMKRFDADLTNDQLREKILDAADVRFRTFGFQKTAMAEIAKDVGMSTANLYRYFPKKIDIAEGFALRCFVEKEKMLLQVVDVDKNTASVCLQKMAVELLRFNFQQLNDYPMINDIVMALCAERPALVLRKRQGELDILKMIIEKGRLNEGWRIGDAERVGLSILASWVMFSTSTFMRHQSLAELEEILDGVMDLTFNGLNKGT